MNENNQAPATGGTKLSTIFMVVLGLHIVVIVVISAFYFMKGRSHPEMADANLPSIAEGSPTIAADGTQTPGANAGEPAVETTTAPIISSEMIDTMAGTEAQSPMPATNDPVWATAPATQAAEPEMTNNDLVSSTELRTPPARLVMEPKVLSSSASNKKANVAKAPAPKTPVIAKTPVVAKAPVEKAPVEKASVAKTSKTSTYQVASGDTLTKIAKKNSTTVAKIKQANGLTSDTLKIGQVLKVPGSVSSPVAAPAPAVVASTPAPTTTPAATTTTAAATAPVKPAAKKPAPVVAASGSASSYQVAAGDTLTKIAKKNNTTVAKLKQANNLTNDSLKIGQVLKVPGTAATKAAPQPAPVREADATPTKKPFREPVITMDMARL